MIKSWLIVVVLVLLKIIHPITSIVTSKRMVGYIEDWQNIPPTSVLSHYTHIMYAFIQGDEFCTLSLPDQDIVDAIHNAGVLVLASIGGSSMDAYWKDCTADTLVNQILTIVNNYNFDGVDIDYEVDPPDQNLVVSLNNQLRSSLPSGKLLTHAPENNMMVEGGSYWNILQQCNGVDFISVQYYNDLPAPTKNQGDTLKHYDSIVTDLFGGDASKVVFGYCITDCGSYNMNADAATAFTEKIVAGYGSSFGGVMNWAINQGDNDGSWSSAVLTALGAADEPDLLTYYPFEPSDVNVDQVLNYLPAGSQFTGTLQDNAAISSENAVMGGGSLFLQNSFMTDSSSYSTGANGISFSFFFQTVNSQGSTQKLFDFGNGPSNDNIAYAPGQGLIVYIGSSSYLYPLPTTLDDGYWHHLAWTLSPTSHWTVYVDLQKVFDNDVIYPNSISRTSKFIGGSNWNSDANFNGFIDDFRVYDGVISENLITVIYEKSELAPSYSPPAASSSSALSNDEIIGIAVGIGGGIVLIILCFIGYCLYRHHHQNYITEKYITSSGKYAKSANQSPISPVSSTDLEAPENNHRSIPLGTVADKPVYSIVPKQRHSIGAEASVPKSKFPQYDHSSFMGEEESVVVCDRDSVRLSRI